MYPRSPDNVVTLVVLEPAPPPQNATWSLMNSAVTATLEGCGSRGKRRVAYMRRRAKEPQCMSIHRYSPCPPSPHSRGHSTRSYAQPRAQTLPISPSPCSQHPIQRSAPQPSDASTAIGSQHRDLAALDEPLCPLQESLWLVTVHRDVEGYKGHIAVPVGAR